MVFLKSLLLSNQEIYSFLFVMRTGPMIFFLHVFDMDWGIMHIFENQDIFRISQRLLKKKWVQKNLTLESKANYSQEEAKSTWRMTTQIDLAVKSTFYFLLLQEESNPERSYK